MLFRERDSGFTLAEVMVSLVIFMVASMGLLPLLLTNIQANQALALYSKARQLAGKVMAEIQVVDYADLSRFSELSLRRGKIEIQQQVEKGRPSANQSRITVTAVWQQRGATHRYQLQTIRSKP